MTQTPQPPRDWQKDMEMCKDITSMSSKSEFVRMANYWLQESMNWEHAYQIANTALIREKARADAAEAREQRQNEDIRAVIAIWENMADFADPEDIVQRMVAALKATLYPDTPAPTTKEEV